MSHGYLALESQLPQTTGLNSSVLLESGFNGIDNISYDYPRTRGSEFPIADLLHNSSSSNTYPRAINNDWLPASISWSDQWDMYSGCDTGMLPEGTWNNPNHILGSRSLSSVNQANCFFPQDDVSFSTLEAQNIEPPALYQNLNWDFGTQNLTSSQHNSDHGLSNQSNPRFTNPFQSNDRGLAFDLIGIQGPGAFVPPDPQPREHSRLGALEPLLPIGVESRLEPSVPKLPSTEKFISHRSSEKRSLSSTKDNAKRTRTRRKRNVCVRCRLMKELCDEEDPCSKCIAVERSAVVRWPRCWHEKLGTIMTFRNGNSRANQIESVLPELRWASEDRTVHTLTLAYPFLLPSQNNRSVLEVQCRIFKPREGKDILTDVWQKSDGTNQTIVFPPLGCQETQALSQSLQTYVDASHKDFDSDLASETTHKLTRLTIAEAARYASKNPASHVAKAMCLRRLSYFCRESMIVASGDEGLDITPLDDEGSPNHGRIFVPSVLDFQIDTVAIILMRKAQEDCVKALEADMRSSGSKKQWYPIYLTFFILLQTLERVTELQYSYNQWTSDAQANTAQNVSYITNQMVEQWKHSAKNLVIHYRFIVRAMIPFQYDWINGLDTIDDDVKVNLDSQALRYMAKVTEELRNQPFGIDAAVVGQPFVWVSQLYNQEEECSCDL
ncbi:hypothetical protein F4860DRAFT_497665 [Xylaria cubensis]|nr:hypothetical protein F4860DRAFT_497665 [Xylaria cubensis]